MLKKISAIEHKDFCSQYGLAADVNSDSKTELLFVQSEVSTREITCLTVTDVDGNILWQHGAPSAANGLNFSDLPVKVTDWDGDGYNEVLWIEQAVYEKYSVWQRTKNGMVDLTSVDDIRGNDDFAREGGPGTVFGSSARLHVLDGWTGWKSRSSTWPIPRTTGWTPPTSPAADNLI